MLRSNRLGADALWDALARRGFLTANLNRVNGIKDRQFLRMTICAEADNDLFVDACRQIEADAAA